MPDGTLGGAETDEDCAVTATAATAITMNSLENMEEDAFFRRVGQFLWGS